MQKYLNACNFLWDKCDNHKSNDQINSDEMYGIGQALNRLWGLNLILIHG